MRVDHGLSARPARESQRAATTLQPAHLPVQRPVDARLLRIDAQGRFEHLRRARWIDALRRGDLVVANDAAALPASLTAVHERSRRNVELRIAARAPRATHGEPRFDAIVFGEGDWRTRTEHRAAPPPLEVGDRLVLGDDAAVIDALLDHPRFVRARFAGSEQGLWSLLARRGRPIQYAHLHVPLQLFDVWTAVAARPAAFEPPSAGFVLDWDGIGTLRARGIGFATLTHAAGISSTGDPLLDARLPLAEPYTIPLETAAAITSTRARGRRVIAIGTSVVRALEHAASRAGSVASGDGVADQRIGAHTRLRVVDAILTGTHEPGASHHDLLRAFVSDATLAAAGGILAVYGYRTHEFGDSMLVERAAGEAG